MNTGSNNAFSNIILYVGTYIHSDEKGLINSQGIFTSMQYAKYEDDEYKITLPTITTNTHFHMYLNFQLHDIILRRVLGISHYFIEQDRLDLEIAELANVARTHDGLLEIDNTDWI